MTDLQEIKKEQIKALWRDPEATIGAMLQHEQADTPVAHYFGPGIYIREVKLPAGSLCVGEEHRFPVMNVLVQGRVTLLQPDGSEMEVEAPFIFTNPAGRKIGVVHEDAIWLNIHATEETDVEKIEDACIIKSQAVLDHKKRKEIEK